jgi:hypothetical protein
MAIATSTTDLTQFHLIYLLQHDATKMLQHDATQYDGTHHDAQHVEYDAAHAQHRK